MWVYCMHILIRRRLFRYFLKTSLLVLFFCFSCSSVYAAKLELITPQLPNKTDVFPVSVYLNTEGQKTIGTDLLLSYDPKLIEFVRVEPSTMYSRYPDAQIDLVRHQIRYSGTSQFNNYQESNGIFATFYFRPILKKNLKDLNDVIKLIWQKNSTNDTNVVSIEGKELLTQEPPILRIEQKNPEGAVEGISTEYKEDTLSKISTPNNAKSPQISFISKPIIVGISLILVLLILLIIKKIKKLPKL